MEWIIAGLVLVAALIYRQRSHVVRNRQKLCRMMGLDGWLDTRYALRSNEEEARLELLDFIRFEHDPNDSAYCLYPVSEIKCGREYPEKGCENDCVLVVHTDGTEQKIKIDRRFNFDCSAFCERRTPATSPLGAVTESV